MGAVFTSIHMQPGYFFAPLSKLEDGIVVLRFHLPAAVL
jgi:hypothetical protein